MLEDINTSIDLQKVPLWSCKTRSLCTDIVIQILSFQGKYLFLSIKNIDRSHQIGFAHHFKFYLYNKPIQEFEVLSLKCLLPDVFVVLPVVWMGGVGWEGLEFGYIFLAFRSLSRHGDGKGDGKWDMAVWRL